MGAKISILPPKKGFFTPKNNFSKCIYFFPSNVIPPYSQKQLRYQG